jgi:hypothetical protein
MRLLIALREKKPARGLAGSTAPQRRRVADDQ